MTNKINLCRKADRTRFVVELLSAIEARCPSAVVEECEVWADHLRVRACVPGLLSVSVSWLRTDGQAGLRVPLAAWHGAARRLRGVPGAWHSWDVNPFHGCKATGMYGTLPELVEGVVAGLNAAANGSAFAETVLTQIDDFDVQDCGSIVLLRAVSLAARDWVEEHLPEDRQMFADATVIERRYFGDIYEGIIADGLTIS